MEIYTLDYYTAEGKEHIITSQFPFNCNERIAGDMRIVNGLLSRTGRLVIEHTGSSTGTGEVFDTGKDDGYLGFIIREKITALMVRWNLKQGLKNPEPQTFLDLTEACANQVIRKGYWDTDYVIRTWNRVRHKHTS